MLLCLFVSSTYTKQITQRCPNLSTLAPIHRQPTDCVRICNGLVCHSAGRWLNSRRRMWSNVPQNVTEINNTQATEAILIVPMPIYSLSWAQLAVKNNMGFLIVSRKNGWLFGILRKIWQDRHDFGMKFCVWKLNLIWPHVDMTLIPNLSMT